LAFGREATAEEVVFTAAFIDEAGLAAFARVLFNSNEFLYVN
jgi:hypothetical protein